MTSWGSSPRMRGAPSEELDDRAVVRIIPADAGSTGSCVGPSGMGGDHPRGCGEHPNLINRSWMSEGSSPRMRGALVLRLSVDGEIRIIPADAGSTYRRLDKMRSAKDHPRGCGEHCSCGGLLSCLLGSSPRMRGAHEIPVGGDPVGGIIPADAGSTCRRCCATA